MWNGLDYFFVGWLTLICFQIRTLHRQAVCHPNPIFDCRHHGLQTPNEGINQRNLKIWADAADKICYGCTKKIGSGSWFSTVQWRGFPHVMAIIISVKRFLHFLYWDGSSYYMKILMCNHKDFDLIVSLLHFVEARIPIKGICLNIFCYCSENLLPGPLKCLGSNTQLVQIVRFT
jgi:hypothetical protein